MKNEFWGNLIDGLFMFLLTFSFGFFCGLIYICFS
jgi:hypothetical protein